MTIRSRMCEILTNVEVVERNCLHIFWAHGDGDTAVKSVESEGELFTKFMMLLQIEI
jgi:hypothetical protein